MSKPRRPTLEVFWERVDKTSDNGCWFWTGAQKPKIGKGGFGDYGRFVPYRGCQLYAHRVSWEIHNGPIPKGMFVLHKCDNPACVRPDHLFLGSHQDNMDDARRKGRAKNQNVYVTHCPKGHLYDSKNTRFSNGKRYCKTCGRIASLEYYYRRRRENANISQK